MPVLYDPIARFVRLLARAFFRRVDVEGLENVPETGGVIVVSWHPNGLIDPGLIVAVMPRPVIFGARHGLFRWPLLGWMMRAAGVVPIYRATDKGTGTSEERRAANRHSLDVLAAKVAGGGVSCLFPEGDSHDAPHLLSLKTGAARFYYQARQQQEPGQPAPQILPVGLHYDDKQRFRSSALVSIHPPLQLPDPLDLTPAADEPEQVARDRCRALTDEIDRVLREVVHATESWDMHHIMHRASKLVRAERAHRVDAELESLGMVEREFGFARIWAGYYHWLGTRPEQTRALMVRVAEYDADMRALGIEDEELDRAPARGRALRLALLMGQMVGVYLLMPALLVLGSAINIGPYLLLRIISRLASRKVKDVATIKVLAGALLYPLTWMTAAGLGAVLSTWLHQQYEVIPVAPQWAALAVLTLGIVGGMVALRYLQLVRETTRALRVRMTRARQKVTLARLRVERSELATALEDLEEGLDLPGSVTARGEVISSEEVPHGGRR